MEVKLIDYMGDDLRVANAARVSFNKESEWDKTSTVYMDGTTPEVLKREDAKLIRYLATHNHWTPFSHCVVTLREKVPIFVARQRFKHMVGFTYNEVSRRYVDDEPEFFTPYDSGWKTAVFRKRPEDGIKQGSSDEIVDPNTVIEVGPYKQDIATVVYNVQEDCQILYEILLENGVAPEQARMVLPQSMYTEYYVTGSLAAWARAYKLRIDPHAQKEIQDLAKMWGDVIAPLFPISWKALTE